MKEVIFIHDGEEIASLNDLFLLLKSPPKISAPEPKTYYVDIPGKHGHLDLSTALTGEVRYKNRKIELEFVPVFFNNLYNDYAYTIVLNALHGKTMEVQLPDKIIDCVWVGKILVGEPEIEKSHIMTIKVTVDAYPYRYSLDNGEEAL